MYETHLLQWKCCWSNILNKKNKGASIISDAYWFFIVCFLFFFYEYLYDFLYICSFSGVKGRHDQWAAPSWFPVPARAPGDGHGRPGSSLRAHNVCGESRRSQTEVAAPSERAGEPGLFFSYQKKSTTVGLFTSGPGCMFPENQVKGVFWNLIQLMLTRMKEPCYSPNINDLRLCLLRFVKLNRCITPVQTERGAYSIFMAGQNSRKSKWIRGNNPPVKLWLVRLCWSWRYSNRMWARVCLNSLLLLSPDVKMIFIFLPGCWGQSQGGGCSFAGTESLTGPCWKGSPLRFLFLWTDRECLSCLWGS